MLFGTVSVRRAGSEEPGERKIGFYEAENAVHYASALRIERQTKRAE